MSPPFPSLTSEWHKETYAAIDPKRAELSLSGSRVVITGGGTGIGKSLAQAFADAGAKSVAIIGRRSNLLEATKKEVESATKTQVTTHAVDICDATALKRAAEAIGTWDILISNAGYCAAPAPLASTDAADWWASFEINCKGTLNMIQAFTATQSSAATFISVNTGAMQVPAGFLPGASAYMASKIATLKMMEALAVEQPDLHVVSMHPGIVDTDLFQTLGVFSVPVDEANLSGHFAVWLCSQEAKFLRGRFVWSNWDVPQLLAKKAEIESNPLLTLPNACGWPYAP